MGKFLSLKETANLLGVAIPTLRNWDKAGKLVSYRNPINGYRVYKLSQIEEFFENMRKERNRRGRFKVVVRVEENA
ncbi:MAG: MerR family DNA-binding transcriptional regulator [Candidatus Portnoybacteria bacterium]|nr:MerR family DNA-binding transcriptional regulator [Candidatus Portnoybacteria bacterium]